MGILVKCCMCCVKTGTQKQKQQQQQLFTNQKMNTLSSVQIHFAYNNSLPALIE
jgi:hypothetical protein